MNKHLETVRNFIVDNFLFGDGKKLSTETLLLEKGIIDSTGVLELVAFIEENFNIRITDEELVQENFSSLSAIDRFIHFKNNQVAAQ